MFKTVHPVTVSPPMLPGFMVESNHDEERFARVEQMIEALQRESAALKAAFTRLALAVFAPAPAPVKPQRQR